MKSRVLVVDDEEIIVSGLTALLEAHQIESAGALDRQTAEAMIAETFYSIILADVRLNTEAEGLQLLEDIQRLSPRSRVLSMTGYATAELELEVRARGSLEMIRKPSSNGEIIGMITELLAEIERVAAEAPELEPAELQIQMRKVLFSIAQRRFGLSLEAAEDVVQDAWLLYLERRGLIHSPRGWLAGTVANLCRRSIDQSIRSRRRSSRDEPLEKIVDGGSNPESGIAVREALAGLDISSRRLCTLIGIDGYAYEEVSLRTGLPLGSIGPMYMRAKKKLRAALAIYAPAPPVVPLAA